MSSLRWISLHRSAAVSDNSSMQISLACAAFLAVMATQKKPVTDAYHGVKVVDDYRWLEDVNDPAVRAWSDRQNRDTRSYLDALPMRPAIYERVKQIRSYPSPRDFVLEYRKNVLFAIKRQPPKQQPFLVTLQLPDTPGSEHVVVDPNQLDTKGTTAIHFYVP